jgi:hypothetical protein
MRTTSEERAPRGRAARFELEVNQNPYLSPRAREMHAIVTVTAEKDRARPPGSDRPPERAEVILVDCSGSMSVPRTKIAAAVSATAAAIDALRAGTWFAVVAGTFHARLIYPREQAMIRASPSTKAAAQAAVALLTADGGTAIGAWLHQARVLLDRHPGAIRHALLLTDGKNEGEPTEQLDRVLADCKGRFGCDARGIGDDYEPRELLRIADVLMGTAEAIREHGELTADFRRLMESSMSNVVTDLRLDIRPAKGAQVRFVKEVYPIERDLTLHGVRLDRGAMTHSTGAWGEGYRDFHVCLAVSAGGRPRHEDLQAASIRLTVATGGQPEGAAVGPPAPILVHWTDDGRLSSRYHPKLSFYSRQGDLSQAVRAGYDAYVDGDRDNAQEHWRCALVLAEAVGNQEVLTRLDRVLDVVDAGAGKASLRESIDTVDVYSVLFGSTRRAPYPGERAAEDQPRPAEPRPDQTCGECGRIGPGDALYCEQCGDRLQADTGSGETGRQAT